VAAEKTREVFGPTPNHVKNSKEIVQVLGSLQVNTHDIMVSFDIESLFTKMPIRETTDLLRCHFEEDVLGLFRHVLITSYFTFNEQFYGQTNSVATGSPLSPVIANFYMEDYENAALESAPLIPRCLFHYVDDAFVIWEHGPEKLKDFVHHLNSIHQSIQFSMETEIEGHLPFLDLDIYSRPDGKPTHTTLYLNAKSHHHPCNKQAVLSTLIHRARALCDEDSLQAELLFLKDVFKKNGYNDRQIHRALNRRPPLTQPNNEPHSVAFLALS
jgi:hypothetical protein